MVDNQGVPSSKRSSTTSSHDKHQHEEDDLTKSSLEKHAPNVAKKKKPGKKNDIISGDESSEVLEESGDEDEESGDEEKESEKSSNNCTLMIALVIVLVILIALCVIGAATRPEENKAEPVDKEEKPISARKELQQGQQMIDQIHPAEKAELDKKAKDIVDNAKKEELAAEAKNELPPKEDPKKYKGDPLPILAITYEEFKEKVMIFLFF